MLITLNNITNANEMVIWPCSEIYNTRNAEQKTKPVAPFLGSEKKCFVPCCFAPHHKHKKRKKSCKDQIIQWSNLALSSDAKQSLPKTTRAQKLI